MKAEMNRTEFLAECAARLKAYNDKHGFWFREEKIAEIMQEILIDGEPAPDIDDKLRLYEDQMDATRFFLSSKDQEIFGCTSIVVIDRYEIDDDDEKQYAETVGYLFC